MEADVTISSRETLQGRKLQVNREAGPQFFENPLLTYKEAARYLSLSESYLRRLKGKGQIPCVLVSDRGVRFRVSSLNRWIEKREVMT